MESETNYLDAHLYTRLDDTVDPFICIIQRKNRLTFLAYKLKQINYYQYFVDILTFSLSNSNHMCTFVTSSEWADQI